MAAWEISIALCCGKEELKEDTLILAEGKQESTAKEKVTKITKGE